MPNTPLKGDYNTYIGARYVPIIGGMWNQQTEYEPLTIVMYQGSSYTSKTFVPKGTQIDNTTYWVRTANYDEQVEFYRSEVQQFKKDIDASEAEYIATVQKAQNDYENKLTDRQNKYETKTTADLTAIANSATAPIFVSTTDEMTDNTKIYVLKTNGHIYAYNGTTIADTSLTYPDYDSIFLIKGEATADLNDETVAGVYKLGNSTAHTNVPDNYAGGLLTVFKNGDYEIVQTFYGLNKKGAEASSTKFDMYVRHMYFNFSEKLSGWTPWEKVAYDTDGRIYRTYGEATADLNDETVAGVYKLGNSTAHTNVPDNYAGGLLTVFKNGDYEIVQTFYGLNKKGAEASSTKFDMYVRHMYFNFSEKLSGWTPWEKVAYDTDGRIYRTYGEATADLNDETVAGVYKIGSGTAHTNVPDNYINALLTVFKNGDYELVQTLYGLSRKDAEASSTNLDMYVRHMYFNFSKKLSGWTPWQKVAYDTDGRIYRTYDEATADLNDETVAGVYRLGNFTAHTNAPDNYTSGLLTVFKNGDYEIVQTFYGLNIKGAEASSTNLDMYVRHMYFNFSENLSGWTPWQKVAYNNNIYVSTLAGGSVGYRVSFGKYTLDIVHVVDTSTNSDLWNLQNITCDDTIIMQSGTDILGPILISGENNFSGGVHGNEKVKIINILADGKEIKPGAFNDIIINMCSDLYTPSDQSTKFATRYINISITKNKIHVASNIIISKDNLTVERATNSGLFSIKNDVTGIYLQNYVATKDNLPTNGVNVVSKYNIDSILCWKGGAIEIKTIHGNENSTYKGQLAVFTNETPIRYKVYHDTLTNTKVNSGDNIYGEFEYIFY